MEIGPLHADTIRLIFRLALAGDGDSGRMGVKSIAKYLNERKLYTQTGGRWGVGTVHCILTRGTVSGPTLTLRTSGKAKHYRYYTCSTAARQGKTSCKGRTIQMDRLDHLVADYLEHRLLDPHRVQDMLAAHLDRREEQDGRRRAQANELAKRAAEAEQRLKRLSAGFRAAGRGR